MSEDYHHCQRRTRWFFGGVASVWAAWFTHPMELIKVQLQTHTQHKDHMSMSNVIKNIARNEGIRGFYKGLTASMMLRITSSGARIGIYEAGKNHMHTDTIEKQFMLATVAGIFSAAVSMPFDKVNIRMQNDSKLPMELRSNYKNVFDGVRRIYRKEGFRRLFEGYTFTAKRGILQVIGQNMAYDHAKDLLLSLPHFTDSIVTHLTASCIAGITATILIQPLDVIKTRIMNAKPNEYKSQIDVVLKTAREGPLAFYKGVIPASLRMGPQTVLIFVFLEQLRIHFGYYDKGCHNSNIK